MSYGVGEGLGFIFDIKGRVEEIYGDWRGILTGLETGQGALLYCGRRRIAEFPSKMGEINMLSYDYLPNFRGIAEFGFGNCGKILPLDRAECSYYSPTWG